MKQLFTALVLTVWFPFTLFANVVGLISHLEGDVYRKGNQKVIQGPFMPVTSQDSLKSSKNANLVACFRDGSHLILFRDSSIKLDFDANNQINRIELEYGNIWLLVNETGRLYNITSGEVQIQTHQAAMRVQYNRSKQQGLLKINSGSVQVLNSGTTNAYTEGQFSFAKGSIKPHQKPTDQILLTSNEPNYYLPKSGQVPIMIRATLPQELSLSKPLPAFIISSSANLVSRSSIASFNQNKIEIQASAIGTGDSNLYLISEPQNSNIGFEGVIPVNVSPMQYDRVMTIKTARGDIKLKFKPKNAP